MAEWKVYDGSDEQIAEINNSGDCLLRLPSGRERYRSSFFVSDLPKIIEVITHYLICEPHPLREMIKQQADTGQDVYIGQPSIIHDGEWYNLEPTTTPDWNIPNAEYRFTPFED